MNDYNKAAKMIGNRFDLVLVASERMREIHRERREAEEYGNLTVEQRRKETPPHQRTITNIEDGHVGKEYLDRIKSRNIRKRPKFDQI